MKNFLFLLRTDPDIDHIAPLIWKCLEQGERTYVTFVEGFPYANDYRIQFLMKYPNFKVLSLAGVMARSRFVHFASRLLWNYYSIRSLLRRYEISACFFEWG